MLIRRIVSATILATETWRILPSACASSVIDELVVCDTIPLSEEAQALGKIRQVSVASMVAETIRRINNEESISAMFDSYL